MSNRHDITCPICQAWPPPRNCGHGWDNGQIAPRATFTRPHVHLIEIGRRAHNHNDTPNEYRHPDPPRYRSRNEPANTR